jgi:hypothetical protein
VLRILVLVPQPSNPGDGVSEIVLLLSHQRGKKPKKQTKEKKTRHRCSTVSVSLSA